MGWMLNVFVAILAYFLSPLRFLLFTYPAVTVSDLELHVEGPERGEPLLFVHGWPDNQTMWDHQNVFSHFVSQGYRCARVTMPHYNSQSVAKFHPLGYNFNDIAEMLRTTITHLSPSKPITLVLHDWGVVYGLETYARHPNLVKRLVMLDVGKLAQNATSLHEMGKRYQYVGRLPGLQWLGDSLSQKIVDGFKAVMEKTNSYALTHIHTPSVTSAMGFSYFYLHFDYWSERLLGMPADRMRSPKEPTPTVPTLFLWGANKPFNFHPPKFPEELNSRTDGSAAYPIKSGHWVSVEQGAEVSKYIGEFLHRTHAS
eukprot:gnl/Spiro4/7101_TR3695_c0_g1_i1.p2 gnl/Spiro4/7101_TR3695_c0_g1~~gnl/Spiro4/7101_TR3695_c0_g1_i1.p2  ORF type:complete len:336 (-),score=81.71 gnl/Spiro4/7101_TR3695_c0_g1_i1:46-984(-)